MVTSNAAYLVDAAPRFIASDNTHATSATSVNCQSE
jgi:hypothetical protein